MPHPPPEWWLPDPQRGVALSELARMCSLSMDEVGELVEYGALVPMVSDDPDRLQFSASCVPALREAARLRRHYDLDLFTVSLLLPYLQRIAQLEQQLRSVQAHLPHPVQLPREGPTPWREPH